MPELPDVTAYIAALEARVLGRRLERVCLGNPFVLRSVAPPLRAAAPSSSLLLPDSGVAGRGAAGLIAP